MCSITRVKLVSYVFLQVLSFAKFPQWQNGWSFVARERKNLFRRPSTYQKKPPSDRWPMCSYISSSFFSVRSATSTARWTTTTTSRSRTPPTTGTERQGGVARIDRVLLAYINRLLLYRLWWTTTRWWWWPSWGRATFWGTRYAWGSSGTSGNSLEDTVREEAKYMFRFRGGIFIINYYN